MPAEVRHRPHRTLVKGPAGTLVPQVWLGLCWCLKWQLSNSGLFALAVCITHFASAPSCGSAWLQVFELNMWKAWSAVFIAVASFAASLYLISICPAPLLPLAWALSGTAMTGVSRCLAGCSSRLHNSPACVAWMATHPSHKNAQALCGTWPPHHTCTHSRVFSSVRAPCSGLWSATTAATAPSPRTSWWRTLWAH